MRIFRETKEFVCEECRTIHDLPYERIDGKAVCDGCFRAIENQYNRQVERHLNGEF
jgi:uncharacterized paraquat-inducible protein A